jgi:hypothetical protein
MISRWINITFLTLVVTLTAGSQTVRWTPDPRQGDSIFVVAWEWTPDDPQDRNTPDYRLYRRGYESILREDWESARKHFAEISAKYSSSEYADDAAYWSAYALMHVDSTKALQAYRMFLKKYPRSHYFDDAVADFAWLEAQNHLRRAFAPGAPTIILEPPAALPDLYGRAFGGTTGSAHFRSSVFRWNLTLFQRPQPGKLAPAVEELLRRENVDPATRTRIEGLTRIPDPTRNERAFQVVKDVSIDLRQPEPVRFIALRSLADFRDFDVMDVYLAVVEKDTSPELRTVAIRSLGQAIRDSGQVADTLIRLYEKTPGLQLEIRRELIGAVAATGNHRAVEFLTALARGEANPMIRISAIEGLGRIPRQPDKSLEVLIELYGKEPRSGPEVLSTALFSAAEIGGDKAVDFLARVARTEKDPRLRGEAVYYLSNIGGEKARTALRQILLETRQIRPGE